MRRALAVAVYFAALIGGSSLIRLVLPEPQRPQISNKLSYYRQNGSQIDTLLIGSSRIYHGISPKVFDAVMRKKGNPTRSFNLGVDDMKPPESLKVLHEALRIHPIKRVILEWCRLQIDPHRPDQTTSRDIAWHDCRWTYTVLREVAGGRRRHLYTSRAFELYSVHSQLLAENFLNIGSGGALFRFDATQSGSLVDIGPDLDGYRPRSQSYWRDALAFRDQVNQVKDGGSSIDWLDDPKFSALIAETASECARYGARMVCVIAPTLDPVPRPNPQVPTLAFNDPLKYPVLFASRARTDPEHLDHDGAVEFSKALANAYAELPSAP